MLRKENFFLNVFPKCFMRLRNIVKLELHLDLYFWKLADVLVRCFLISDETVRKFIGNPILDQICEKV